MDKLMSFVGGRKFALSIVTMAVGIGVALNVPTAVVDPLLVFLAACLSAFCASNWAASREYHKTQMKVAGVDNPQVKQLIAENKKLLKALDNALESSNNGDTAGKVLENLDQLNETLFTVGQTSGTTLQAVQQLNTRLSSILQLKG